MSQLAFDGRAVPISDSMRGWRMTEAQREIMARIAIDGQVRPVAAGVILLLMCETRPGMFEVRRRYASSIGVAALRRLEKRGLVERQARGVWVRAAQL